MILQRSPKYASENWARDPTTIEIVYDMDDILHAYVARVSKEAGINLEEWRDFYVPNNNWPEEWKQRANQALSRLDLFDDIEFFEGAEDILRPQFELGVPVKIRSNYTIPEAGPKKRASLLAKIPGLDDSNIDLKLIQLHSSSPKVLAPNTLIFVDDNPYYARTSTARITVMQKWPWNTSSEAQCLLGGKHIVQLDNLQAINRFVFHRTLVYLRTGV